MPGMVEIWVGIGIITLKYLVSSPTSRPSFVSGTFSVGPGLEVRS